MKNARLCMMTLATVTALCSAQAMAAETIELQGERLAKVILGMALPNSGIYVMPVSVEQKAGPDIVKFPTVKHCFENPTGHGNFQLEMEAALSSKNALDANVTAGVSVLLEDPIWTEEELSSPQAARSAGFSTNPSSTRANISIDPASDSSFKLKSRFKNYVVALNEVINSPKQLCMELDFSRGLGSVGVRSIRLVPVP